jgi:hypothetical protein
MHMLPYDERAPLEAGPPALETSLSASADERPMRMSLPPTMLHMRSDGAGFPRESAQEHVSPGTQMIRAVSFLSDGGHQPSWVTVTTMPLLKEASAKLSSASGQPTVGMSGVFAHSSAPMYQRTLSDGLISRDLLMRAPLVRAPPPVARTEALLDGHRLPESSKKRLRTALGERKNRPSEWTRFNGYRPLYWKCLFVLRKVTASPSAQPFMVINDGRSRLDLRRMETKLDQVKYNRFRDFEKDFRSIVKKCLSVHGAESDMYNTAQQMAKVFDQAKVEAIDYIGR